LGQTKVQIHGEGCGLTIHGLLESITHAFIGVANR
jgi:hypothetical protein